MPDRKLKKGKPKVPEAVEHMVAALIKRGFSRERAWATAVARAQQLGYLKKGTLDLTKKGKAWNAKHLKEPISERLKKLRLALGKSKKGGK